MIETTYVSANTTHGVYKIDPVDFPNLELMTIKDFVAALPTLTEGEEIFTVFDPESEDLYIELDNEYGIH